MRPFMNILTDPDGYIIDYHEQDLTLQPHARHLCWQLNQLDPLDDAGRRAILSELLGTFADTANVHSGF